MSGYRRATCPGQSAPVHDRLPSDTTRSVTRTALIGCALHGVTERDRSQGAGAVMRLAEQIELLEAERDMLRDENAQLRRALCRDLGVA